MGRTSSHVIFRLALLALSVTACGPTYEPAPRLQGFPVEPGVVESYAPSRVIENGHPYGSVTYRSIHGDCRTPQTDYSYYLAALPQAGFAIESSDLGTPSIHFRRGSTEGMLAFDCWNPKTHDLVIFVSYSI